MAQDLPTSKRTKPDRNRLQCQSFEDSPIRSPKQENEVRVYTGGLPYPYLPTLKKRFLSLTHTFFIENQVPSSSAVIHVRSLKRRLTRDFPIRPRSSPPPSCARQLSSIMAPVLVLRPSLHQVRWAFKGRRHVVLSSRYKSAHIIRSPLSLTPDQQRSDFSPIRKYNYLFLLIGQLRPTS